MSSALFLPFFSTSTPKVEAPVVTVAAKDTSETEERLAQARRREAARLTSARTRTMATSSAGLADTARLAKKTLG